MIKMYNFPPLNLFNEKRLLKSIVRFEKLETGIPGSS